MYYKIKIKPQLHIWTDVSIGIEYTANVLSQNIVVMEKDKMVMGRYISGI